MFYEDEYEPDVLWLPKLSDCVNFENPAEVPVSINTLFNSITTPDGFGDKTTFWRYLQQKFGEHRLLWQYTVQYPTPTFRVRRYNPDNVRVNSALISLFAANDMKYKRLLSSLNTKYNVLAPYNIEEEHSEGSKSSLTTMTYGERTANEKETSNDDLTAKLKGQSVVETYDDTIDRSHDQSIPYKDGSLGEDFDEASHKKDSRIGNIGNHSFAELIEKEVELSRINFWDIVCKDITDMVCLKMFMSC